MVTLFKEVDPEIVAKAPVKITYTREEVFWAHRGRPRTIVDMKTGVDKEGHITAVKARVVQDGGAHLRSSGAEDLLHWTDAQWEQQRAARSKG